MAEDYGLCTFEKHHKLKILLFLSSMRSYAEKLDQKKYKIKYFKIEDKVFLANKLFAKCPTKYEDDKLGNNRLSFVQ
mgnify:CR=1 FL=1